MTHLIYASQNLDYIDNCILLPPHGTINNGIIPNLRRPLFRVLVTSARIEIPFLEH